MTTLDQQKQAPEPKQKKYVDPLEVVAVVIISWALLCVACLLGGMPFPKTGRGWALFIILGPPIFLGPGFLGAMIYDFIAKHFGMMQSVPLRRIVVFILYAISWVAVTYIASLVLP